MIFRFRPASCLAGLALIAASTAGAQNAPPVGNSRPAAPAATQRPAPPPAPGAAPAAEETPPPERIANPVAQFAGLDKVTGRIFAFDVKVDETVQFGALQVTPRVCYTRPPTEQPETIAFVEVDEITLQNETKRIFAGWMFAASPGLNAVEHPIYDVWVTDCKGGARIEAPEAPKLGE